MHQELTHIFHLKKITFSFCAKNLLLKCSFPSSFNYSAFFSTSGSKSSSVGIDGPIGIFALFSVAGGTICALERTSSRILTPSFV